MNNLLKNINIVGAFILGICLIASGQTHTYPALDTNNVFTGTNVFNGNTTFSAINSLGNLNGVEVVDGVRNANIGAALSRVGTSGTVLFPSNSTEHESSGLTLGAKVDLELGINSLFYCNLTSGTCLTEGSDSRVSGTSDAIVGIQGGGGQTAISLITNNSASEYFQFDHFAFATGTSDTYSKAAMEIEGGFVPSFIDNVIGICSNGTGGVPCLHLTTDGIAGEGAGDYTINQSVFECLFITGCTPLRVDAPASGSHMENVTIYGSAFQHPATGTSDVVIDGTTGSIFNFNILASRFEGDNGGLGDTTPLVSYNNVDSANMFASWLAPLCTSGCNPFGIQLNGNMNQFVAIGDIASSSNGINNLIDGRQTSGYIPLYIYSLNGTPTIESKQFIFSSPGDFAYNLHINSGRTTSEITQIFFDDQDVAQWVLQKAGNENLQVLDSQNSSKPRLVFAPGSFININSGGTSPVNFNINTPSGTGGVVFGNGAGTTVAAIDSTGELTQTGVAFASLTSATAGTQQWCTDCQVTTAASCSTATPASCVCKASGTGAFAKRMNYQGAGLNWYCQ